MDSATRAQLNSSDKVSSSDRVGCAMVAAKSMLLASKYGVLHAKNRSSKGIEVD